MGQPSKPEHNKTRLTRLVNESCQVHNLYDPSMGKMGTCRRGWRGEEVCGGGLVLEGGGELVEGVIVVEAGGQLRRG